MVASAKTALEKTAAMRGEALFAAMAIDAIRDLMAGTYTSAQARRQECVTSPSN